MYVVKISDGLGNQMFQYAFAKKLQMTTGEKVYLDIRYINNEDRFIREREKTIFLKKNDPRVYRLEKFRIKIPLVDEKTLSHWKFLECKNEIDKAIFQRSKTNRWIFQYFRETQENKADFMFENRKKLPTYIEGYFFDKRYFDDIRNRLEKDFKPKNPIRLSNGIKQILRTKETVSIHVRRGDFLRHNRDITRNNYYYNAIETMRQHVVNPTWLIFSDDIEWVKENLEISGKKLYVSELGYEDFEELTIMKNCKNHIIANSTFSYWAAYLNPNLNKKVICPKNWKTEIIPDEWIRI